MLVIFGVILMTGTFFALNAIFAPLNCQVKGRDQEVGTRANREASAATLFDSFNLDAPHVTEARRLLRRSRGRSRRIEPAGLHGDERRPWEEGVCGLVSMVRRASSDGRPW